MTTLLASDYSYRPTTEDPFPYWNNLVIDPPVLPIEEAGDSITELWESLKQLIMNYFYQLVGEENIISTVETKDSIKIISTVPNNGITF